jgi:hypothetical protein
MGLAKLDTYDYAILPGVIRISLSGTNDPDIVDIMSEIHRNDGSIYIDGRYYSYLDSYDLYTNNTGSYVDLVVVDVT